MIYLIEYHINKIYKPHKCIRELNDTDLACDSSLSIRVKKRAFTYSSEYCKYNIKRLWVNINNKDAIYSDYYDKILELIKEYNRESKLNKLLNLYK